MLCQKLFMNAYINASSTLNKNLSHKDDCDYWFLTNISINIKYFFFNI